MGRKEGGKQWLRRSANPYCPSHPSFLTSRLPRPPGFICTEILSLLNVERDCRSFQYLVVHYSSSSLHSYRFQSLMSSLVHRVREFNAFDLYSESESNPTRLPFQQIRCYSIVLCIILYTCVCMYVCSVQPRTAEDSSRRWKSSGRTTSRWSTSTFQTLPTDSFSGRQVRTLEYALRSTVCLLRILAVLRVVQRQLQISTEKHVNIYLQLNKEIKQMVNIYFMHLISIVVLIETPPSYYRPILTHDSSRNN